MNEKAVAGIQVKHHGTNQVFVGVIICPPGRALAVNPAPAADFQVVNVVATNEGLRVGGAAGIGSQGQHLEHCIGVHLQIDAAEQCDRPAQISAGRNLDNATACRVGCVDGILNVGSVIF